MRPAERGFTLVELVITCAMILVLATLAMPSFMTYMRTATVRAAAQEASAILNHARQEAIRQNCSVIAARSTGGFTFSRVATCSLPAGAYTVVGMSAGGIFKTSDAVTITGPASVQFNALGSAQVAQTFTLTSNRYASTMRVFVEASGRIRIQQ